MVMQAPANGPFTMNTGRKEIEDEPVKVQILPADPPVQYEQLALF